MVSKLCTWDLNRLRGGFHRVRTQCRQDRRLTFTKLHNVPSTSLNLTKSRMSYRDFTVEETEVQGGSWTCPRSYNQ